MAYVNHISDGMDGICTKSKGWAYIAGPMRNCGPSYNFPAFDAARDRLRAHGWFVISPADLDRVHEGWGACPPANLVVDHALKTRCIRRDLDALLSFDPETDVIYLLRGWEASAGARVEKALADTGKARWDLLPWRSVGEVVRVLTHGAVKYAPDNWQKVPEPRNRYFAAAVRHLTTWWDGEKVDPESGLSHLAHAVCCLLFLMWFDRAPPA
jgi:hypothetical protein